jgi:molybdopterin-guanine dinucleotide biosynthesis protein A
MPLVAFYKKQCMHPILKALKGGERRVTKVVAELNPKTIPLATHLEPYVRNVNTKEELKQLQHELKH